MPPPEHSEPCPSLVDVLRETAAQGAEIGNVKALAKDNHDTIEDMKKIVAAINVKLALVVAGSFAGSAFGGKIFDAAKVAVVWVTDILNSSAYAGY